ncbi:hypothetical protein [Alteromonas gracilis]|uniref:hypothetical protein n=1 Tax=Alteromonas gracilis TaxID=1479524 RepID=UPI003735C78A
MKIKSTLLALALSVTSLSSMAQSAASFPVETSFSTICGVSDAPVALDFTNSLIGESRSIDFSVTLECNFAYIDDNIGISIPPLFSLDGVVVFTARGAALVYENIMDEGPLSITPPGTGEQTVVVDFTAHLVDDVESLGPPTTAFNLFTIAEIFVMLPDGSNVDGGGMEIM